MAIVNRSLDASQQRMVFQSNFGLTATGATLHAFAIPSAGTLEGIRFAAYGLSGTPTVDVRILRFIVGTGVTTIGGVATTLTFTAVGTSGMQSAVMAASGSTLLNLAANDIVTVTTAGTNAAVNGFTVAAVVKATQDIRTSFGL